MGSRRNGIRLVACRCSGLCISKDILLFFLMLRIRGLSMSCFVLHSLINQNKNKKKLTDGVGVC